MGFGTHGVTVRTAPALEVALNVELAPGVPRESVLSNVADAVRYTVQRDCGPADRHADGHGRRPKLTR